LKYLKRNDIDPVLWNACIESNEYYIPYARFEYLDALCNGSWGALVKGRYEAVFPLPYRKKWGLIPYVYQPVFCQQLGVFGNPGNLTTNDFIRKDPCLFCSYTSPNTRWFWYTIKQHNFPTLLKNHLTTLIRILIKTP
jgi:hypothetical protein